MPFDLRTSEGVLTLTLDTPGSPVNIFNHATATQLSAIMAGVDPATTRAVVFETAKPNSFLNGVGLMLAHAARTHEDIVAAAEPPWSAYRAVWECPVPTVAVVQGSCFGCGVEFALNCDYRIASDACATQFYMTELNDYLFIPLFGSTWNLPAAVGLESAIDLLLWGQRWDARTAAEHGLIDEACPYEQLGEGARRFVARVVDGEQVSRRRGDVRWSEREDQALLLARRRIETLPAAYRHVYGEALELLEGGARQHQGYLEHQRRELLASSASARAAIGKAAYSFFYLRQMASQRASGRATRREQPLRIGLAGGDRGDARVLMDDFRRRRLTEAELVDEREAEVCLRSAASLGRPSATQVAGSLAVEVDLSLRGNRTDGVQIYAPAYRSGGRLAEVIVSRTEQAAATGLRTELIRALQVFGFEVALTTPERAPLCDRLLVAYWRPLLAFVETGGDPGAVGATLREAGFVRLPGGLLEELGADAVAAMLARELGRPLVELEPLLARLGSSPCRAGAGEPALLDALCLSLLSVCQSARSGGEARDPAIVDLIARELLDFPRHLCSLCRWLRIDRVRSALLDEARMSELAGPEAVAAALAFVAQRREFYR